MLRRTVPAVSFTTSHRALMIRASRPLLAADMTSTDRFRAAWDETPWTRIQMSKQELWDWDFKARYQLGLRDNVRLTKFGYVWFVLYFTLFVWLGVVELIWPSFYHAWYDVWPAWLVSEEYNRKRAQAWGRDIWCADGKFSTPYFHLVAPMFTMKVEDL